MGDSFYGNGLYGDGNYSQSPYLLLTSVGVATFASSPAICRLRRASATGALVNNGSATPHRVRRASASLPAVLSAAATPRRVRRASASLPIIVGSVNVPRVIRRLSASLPVVIAYSANLSRYRNRMLSCTAVVTISGVGNSNGIGPFWPDEVDPSQFWSDTSISSPWQETVKPSLTWGA